MKKLLLPLVLLPLILVACKKDDPSPGPDPAPKPSSSPAPSTDPSAMPSTSPSGDPAPSAASASPVGTWKFDLDKGTAKPPTDKDKAEAEAMRMEIKADGTYAVSGTDHPSTGKWTVSGDTFTATADGTGTAPPPMKLSEDGNTLTATVPGDGGKTETLVMVKG